MPFFNSQSLPSAAASVLSILVVGAFAFSAVSYVEWSSGVNLIHFMARTAPDASTPVLPLKGRTGCEQGNKPLPALSLPLE
ncbi:hypothetical protein H8A97_09585 [Bradyrhizobium sp. Arg62]|uniref:hypothetical protein n=1 Tax=Bradyrhizobium brasilense TaxID=1419277 RepID=UPI001E2E9539|nr:hypothetical protein [Bradyrhizobium brasilense]MCC8945345.1 hypothetical protein [Bradyrhizobium brasilense]